MHIGARDDISHVAGGKNQHQQLRQDDAVNSSHSRRTSLSRASSGASVMNYCPSRHHRHSLHLPHNNKRQVSQQQQLHHTTSSSSWTGPPAAKCLSSTSTSATTTSSSLSPPDSPLIASAVVGTTHPTVIISRCRRQQHPSAVTATNCASQHGPATVAVDSSAQGATPVSIVKPFSWTLNDMSRVWHTPPQGYPIVDNTAACKSTLPVPSVTMNGGTGRDRYPGGPPASSTRWLMLPPSSSACTSFQPSAQHQQCTTTSASAFGGGEKRSSCLQQCREDIHNQSSNVAPSASLVGSSGGSSSYTSPPYTRFAKASGYWWQQDADHMSATLDVPRLPHSERNSPAASSNDASSWRPYASLGFTSSTQMNSSEASKQLSSSGSAAVQQSSRESPLCNANGDSAVSAADGVGTAGGGTSWLHRRIAKTKMCVHHMHGRCARGVACTFAHHLVELREPPDLYKTRLCINFGNFGRCQKGQSCRFSHGMEELRTSEGELVCAAPNLIPIDASVRASTDTSECEEVSSLVGGVSSCCGASSSSDPTDLDADTSSGAAVAPALHSGASAPVLQSGASAPVLQSADSAPVLQSADSAPVLQSADSAPVLQSDDGAPVLQSADSAPVLRSDTSAAVLQSDTSPDTAGCGERMSCAPTLNVKSGRCCISRPMSSASTTAVSSVADAFSSASSAANSTVGRNGLMVEPTSSSVCSVDSTTSSTADARNHEDGDLIDERHHAHGNASQQHSTELILGAAADEAPFTPRYTSTDTNSSSGAAVQFNNSVVDAFLKMPRNAQELVVDELLLRWQAGMQQHGPQDIYNEIANAHHEPGLKEIPSSVPVTHLPPFVEKSQYFSTGDTLERLDFFDVPTAVTGTRVDGRQSCGQDYYTKQKSECGSSFLLEEECCARGYPHSRGVDAIWQEVQAEHCDALQNNIDAPLHRCGSTAGLSSTASSTSATAAVAAQRQPRSVAVRDGANCIDSSQPTEGERLQVHDHLRHMGVEVQSGIQGTHFKAALQQRQVPAHGVYSTPVLDWNRNGLEGLHSVAILNGRMRRSDYPSDCIAPASAPTAHCSFNHYDRQSDRACVTAVLSPTIIAARTAAAARNGRHRLTSPMCTAGRDLIAERCIKAIGIIDTNSTSASTELSSVNNQVVRSAYGDVSDDNGTRTSSPNDNSPLGQGEYLSQSLRSLRRSQSDVTSVNYSRPGVVDDRFYKDHHAAAEDHTYHSSYSGVPQRPEEHLYPRLPLSDCKASVVDSTSVWSAGGGGNHPDDAFGFWRDTAAMVDELEHQQRQRYCDTRGFDGFSKDSSAPTTASSQPNEYGVEFIAQCFTKALKGADNGRQDFGHGGGICGSGIMDPYGCTVGDTANSSSSSDKNSNTATAVGSCSKVAALNTKRSNTAARSSSFSSFNKPLSKVTASVRSAPVRSYDDGSNDNHHMYRRTDHTHTNNNYHKQNDQYYDIDTAAADQQSPFYSNGTPPDLRYHNPNQLHHRHHTVLRHHPLALNCTGNDTGNDTGNGTGNGTTGLRDDSQFNWKNTDVSSAGVVVDTGNGGVGSLQPFRRSSSELVGVVDTRLLQQQHARHQRKHAQQRAQEEHPEKQNSVMSVYNTYRRDTGVDQNAACHNGELKPDSFLPTPQLNSSTSGDTWGGVFMRSPEGQDHLRDSLSTDLQQTFSDKAMNTITGYFKLLEAENDGCWATSTSGSTGGITSGSTLAMSPSRTTSEVRCGAAVDSEGLCLDEENVLSIMRSLQILSRPNNGIK
eukprot:Lankesteria_metandrocarpae@DN4710_c0_g1_i1.p1